MHFDNDCRRRDQPEACRSKAEKKGPAYHAKEVPKAHLKPVGQPDQTCVCPSPDELRCPRLKSRSLIWLYAGARNACAVAGLFGVWAEQRQLKDEDAAD